MKKIKLIGLATFLTLVGCQTLDPDPWGCNSRGPLVVTDVIMKNAKINEMYCEPVPKTDGFAESKIEDTIKIPKGLKAIDSIGGIFIKGIPEQLGEYEIRIKVSEFGTQCIGRTATFSANIKIE